MPRLPLLAIGTLVAATLVLYGPGTSVGLAVARSQDQAPAADWEGAGLTGPAWRLFAPPSGALLARVADTLYRSDDGGVTWRVVPLPGRQVTRSEWTAAVDPTDHDTLYASGDGGVSKSVDGGQSWTLIAPTDLPARAIAVSPANRNIVYVGVGLYGKFRFLRSDDAGLSWQQLEEHDNMTCGWAVPILLPHPTDENRLLRTAQCYAGRDFYDQLRQSTDRGMSWSTLFGVGRPGVGGRDSQHPEFAFPRELVGGAGAEPSRFYLATLRDSRVGGGASLFRSDDDGRTWTEVFSSRPESVSPAGPAPGSEIIRVGGLAYDPARPATVYLGLNVYVVPPDSSRPTLTRAGVLVSDDGGAIWQPIGRQDLPEISDLALGIDGRNLYVADREDLRRLRLR